MLSYFHLKSNLRHGMYILNIANGRIFRQVYEFRLALRVRISVFRIMAFMARLFPLVPVLSLLAD